MENLNKITLKFLDEKIEKKFKQEYFDKSIGIFRISFVTVTILYAAFGYIDLISAKEYYQLFFNIRYFIVVPILAAVFFLSFNRNFRKVWQELLSLCYIIGGTGIIFMLLKNPENIYYYGGIFLIFNAGYFFIKLRFLAATISGIVLLLIYNIGMIAFHTLYHIHFDYAIIANTFYISANIINAIALYNIELLERKDYYQRNQLVAKQNEIYSANQNLELKIKTRTKQISEHNSKLIEEISKREVMEKALLLAKEKAEESNRLKTAFLNNMSHEIRTPLNGITGFLSLLQDPDIDAEDKQQYIDIINKSSDRLISTVTDIMEISKIESGLIEVSIQEVSVNKLLQETYNFFSLEANSKGLALKQLPSLSDEDSYILADNYMLNRILTNLIKNAIKFTKKGSISFGYHIITNSESDVLMQFFVEDTGIGIPRNRQQAVFNRFEQADIEDTRVFEGSGLGLAIAKSYVEALGGEIWLKSEEGIGAEFMFTIPYKTSIKENKNPQKDLPKRQGDLNKLTILIAEDEEINNQLFELIFRNTFKHIIYVGTGQQAIEACQNNPAINLILMDIKMPDMNGYTATKEIRKFNQDVIIIAQTAFGLEGDREKAIAAGCNDYISKPIDKKLLFEKIKLQFNN